MFKSIRIKMMLIISLLVLVLITASSWFAYYQASNIMEKTIFTESVSIAQQNAKFITEWLEGIRNKIMIASYTEEVEGMDWSQQKVLLEEIAKKEKEIEAIYSRCRRKLSYYWWWNRKYCK